MVESNLSDEIGERLYEEHKLVTYKWLSQTHSIDVNEAKRILERYYKDREQKKHDIYAVYLISGYVKSGNGVKVRNVQLVHSDDLEQAKSQLTELHSEHIYSVQASKLKDSDAIYLTDSSLNNLQSVIQHQYSPIYNDVAVKRDRQMLEQQSKQHHQQNEEQPRAAAKKTVNKPSAQSEKIKESGVETSAKQATTSEKPPEKAVSAKTTTSSSSQSTSEKKNAGNKKPKGVMAFFGNAKPKAPAEESKVEAVKQQTGPGGGDKIGKPGQTSDKDKTENKAAVEAESSKSVSRAGDRKRGTQGKPATIRKATKSSNQKHKRIKLAAADLISSSEEESEQSSSDDDGAGGGKGVVGPSRSRILASDSDDDEDKDGDAVTAGEGQEDDVGGDEISKRADTDTGPSTSGGKRRRRRLVQKTSVDDDGFMVTEKVWESASGSEEDGEGGGDSSHPSSSNSHPSSSSAHPSSSSSHPSSSEKPAATTSKPSPPPPAAQQHRTKQATLTSFFKKKE